MKLILTAFVSLLSVIALADVPRPGVKPGPVGNIGADALNVLVYGAPATKIADLKAGSNLIVVQIQHLDENSSRYIFTSRMCRDLGSCLENKQMSVTKTELIGRGGARVSYQASVVTKLR